jgi:hypothetical protein
MLCASRNTPAGRASVIQHRLQTGEEAHHVEAGLASQSLVAPIVAPRQRQIQQSPSDGQLKAMTVVSAPGTPDCANYSRLNAARVIAASMELSKHG